MSNPDEKSMDAVPEMEDFDPLNPQMRRKMNEIMRKRIVMESTEIAPAKYMVSSGLISYGVGAFLFSLSGSWNAIAAVGAVMVGLSVGLVWYDERAAKRRSEEKVQAELKRWGCTESVVDQMAEMLRSVDTLNRLLDEEIAVNKDLKARLYALEDSIEKA